MEAKNSECFKMMLLKPNILLVNFWQNFILTYVSTFELAQTHISKENTSEKGLSFYHDYETSHIEIW